MVAFSPAVQDGKKVIEQQFPEHHFEVLENRLWAVGAKKEVTTSADVCSDLGIGDAEQRAGVVWQVYSYYGYFNEALWQKLAAWQRHESAAQ